MFKIRKCLALLIILIATITNAQNQRHDTWIKLDRKIIKGKLLDSRNDSILFIPQEEAFYEPRVIIPVEKIDYIKQRETIRNRESKVLLGIFLGGAVGTGGGSLLPVSGDQFYTADIKRGVNMIIGGLIGIVVGGIVGAYSSNPVFKFNIDKKKSNFEKHKEKIQFYY